MYFVALGSGAIPVVPAIAREAEERLGITITVLPRLRLGRNMADMKREQLEGSVVDETRARLLYAFREVTDTELREYLAFLDSEPGAWLSRATQLVGEQVLGASVERFQFEAIRAFSFQKRLVLD